MSAASAPCRSVLLRSIRFYFFPAPVLRLVSADTQRSARSAEVAPARARRKGPRGYGAEGKKKKKKILLLLLLLRRGRRANGQAGAGRAVHDEQ
eukprot:5077137-Prymnesium_polylepis.1